MAYYLEMQRSLQRRGPDQRGLLIDGRAALIPWASSRFSLAADARDLPGMADVDASLLLFCREIKKVATVAQSTLCRATFLKEEYLKEIDSGEYAGRRCLQAVSEALRQVLRDPGASLLRLIRRDTLKDLLRADNPAPWYGQLMTTPRTIAYFMQMNDWLERYRVRIV